ncbi:MAG: hypothetical protein GY716_17355 [bacterium]|nr:hypothetical protein [bacterium]
MKLAHLSRLIVASLAVASVCAPGLAQDPSSDLGTTEKSRKELIARYGAHVTVVAPATPDHVRVRLQKSDFRESWSYLNRVSKGAKYDQTELRWANEVCRLWTEIKGYGVIRHDGEFMPVRSDLEVDLERWKLKGKNISNKEKSFFIPGGFVAGDTSSAKQFDEEFEPAERRASNWESAVASFVALSGEKVTPAELVDLTEQLGDD